MEGLWEAHCFPLVNYLQLFHYCLAGSDAQNLCRSYDLNDLQTGPTRPPRRRTSSQSSYKKISSSTNTARNKSPPQANISERGGYQNQNKPPVPSLRSSIRITHQAEDKSNCLKRSASLADVTNKEYLGDNEKDTIIIVGYKESNSKISMNDSMKECNSKKDKQWADMMNRDNLSLNMPCTMLVRETNQDPHDILANHSDNIAESDNTAERMMVSTVILH